VTSWLVFAVELYTEVELGGAAGAATQGLHRFKGLHIMALKIGGGWG
jgi:hypothetical protein